VVFREIDRIRVKGKDEAITIHEPLGDNRDLAQWEGVLRAYRSREWDAAEALLVSLAREEPGCALYPAYLQKVRARRGQALPSDWDGVTAFEEK
jgi:adenylate cyclase